MLFSRLYANTNKTWSSVYDEKDIVERTYLFIPYSYSTQSLIHQNLKNQN